MRFENFELAIDENGNLSLSNGDTTKLNSVVSLAKLIEWRLLTSRSEWRGQNPLLVAGLPDFKGRQNTEAVAEEMKFRIRQALTYDGAIPQQNLMLDIYPISNEEVVVYIRVRDLQAPELEQQNVEFRYRFSYNDGLIYAITGGTR